MRYYLFRGKTIGYKNNEWVEGNLIVKSGVVYNEYLIAPRNSTTAYKVDPKSVGEYTGLADKNATRIFEGDIVDVAYNVGYVGTAKHRMGLFKVVFHEGCFMKKAIPNPQMSFYDNAERAGMYHFIPSDETEVVGNIFDNPELLGGEMDD